MSDEPQVLVPQMDEDIALADAEDFLSVHSDVVSGRIDSCRFSDLPVGDFEVEIVDAGCRTRKNDKDEILYPNLVFRVRNNDFTTSIFFATGHGQREASRMFTLRILQAFHVILGSDFSSLDAPTAENYTAQSKVEYYNALSAKCVGVKILLRKVSRQGKDGVEYFDPIIAKRLS